MGCDIHSHVEYRRFKGDAKETIWINADKWTVNEDAILYPGDGENYMVVDYKDEIWSKRWYFLFAVLAGVRNAWNVTPISEPKGFPVDASKETTASKEKWGVDGHSHSWLTLKEIKDWPKWDESFITDTLQETTYRDFFYNFWDRSVKRMEELTNGLVSEYDVRMVFWFDN